MKKVVKGYCIAAIIGGVRKWYFEQQKENYVRGKWVDSFEKAVLYKDKSWAQDEINRMKMSEYEKLNYEIHAVEMKLLD